jgi:hypothetical protein
MLRVVPVASETCSPGDQEEDYKSLLHVIGISLAVGVVGGKLIGHAMQQLIAGAKRRMQARTSSATASTGESESARADVGKAAGAATLPKNTAARGFSTPPGPPPRMQPAFQAGQGDWATWARRRDQEEANRQFAEQQENYSARVAAAAAIELERTELGSDPAIRAGPIDWAAWGRNRREEEARRPYPKAVQPTVSMTGAPTTFTEVLEAAQSSDELPRYHTATAFYIPPRPEPGSFDEKIAAARAAGERVPEVDREDQRAGACRHCNRTPEERDTVIVSPHGECYHDRPDCRGLSKATLASRRRPCRLCVGFKV